MAVAYKRIFMYSNDRNRDIEFNKIPTTWDMIAFSFLSVIG